MTLNHKTFVLLDNINISRFNAIDSENIILNNANIKYIRDHQNIYDIGNLINKNPEKYITNLLKKFKKNCSNNFLKTTY